MRNSPRHRSFDPDSSPVTLNPSRGNPSRGGAAGPSSGLSRRFSGALRWGVAPAALLLLSAGCASQQAQETTKHKLESGYAALNEQHYDEAILASNEVLRAAPTGPGAPEALYLRGRGYELRLKPNAAAEASDLQAARTAYLQGLQMQTGPQLEGRLRAGIGLVAYYQDDYATALNQWSLAYDKLEKPEDKLLTLYRIGQSDQRLGRWADADKVLAVVEQQASGTALADKAKSLRGCRAFYVQVAKTVNGKDAGSVVAQLRQQGLAADAVQDPSGGAFQYVRVGPLPGYTQAQAVKTRLAYAYPQAVIVP